MALLGLDGPSIPPDFLSAVSSPVEPVAAHRAALPALRPLFGFLFGDSGDGDQGFRSDGDQFGAKRRWCVYLGRSDRLRSRIKAISSL